MFIWDTCLVSVDKIVLFRFLPSQVCCGQKGTWGSCLLTSPINEAARVASWKMKILPVMHAKLFLNELNANSGTWSYRLIDGVEEVCNYVNMSAWVFQVLVPIYTVLCICIGHGWDFKGFQAFELARLKFYRWGRLLFFTTDWPKNQCIIWKASRKRS